MKTEPKPRSWAISGLRTRYAPKSRIGQGLLSISPWLDILLLLLFFLLIDNRLVLQPGVVIDIPEAAFAQGTHGGMVLVVMSVRGLERGEGEDIVFFDDERFRIQQNARRAALQQALAEHVDAKQDVTLVVQADINVAHGTVMELMSMARRAGVKTVNIATRPL